MRNVPLEYGVWWSQRSWSPDSCWNPQLVRFFFSWMNFASQPFQDWHQHPLLMYLFLAPFFLPFNFLLCLYSSSCWYPGYVNRKMYMKDCLHNICMNNKAAQGWQKLPKRLIFVVFYEVQITLLQFQCVFVAAMICIQTPFCSVVSLWAAVSTTSSYTLLSGCCPSADRPAQEERNAALVCCYWTLPVFHAGAAKPPSPTRTLLHI